jgi:hypothetical protein
MMYVILHCITVPAYESWLFDEHFRSHDSPILHGKPKTVGYEGRSEALCPTALVHAGLAYL